MRFMQSIHVVVQLTASWKMRDSSIVDIIVCTTICRLHSSCQFKNFCANGSAALWPVGCGLGFRCWVCLFPEMSCVELCYHISGRRFDHNGSEAGCWFYKTRWELNLWRNGRGEFHCRTYVVTYRSYSFSAVHHRWRAHNTEANEHERSRRQSFEDHSKNCCWWLHDVWNVSKTRMETRLNWLKGTTDKTVQRVSHRPSSRNGWQVEQHLLVHINTW